MDPLSDVLQAVRLTGAVFFDIHASEPWVAETPPGAAIIGGIFPAAEHLISYHIVTRGSCWGGPLDAPPVRLSAGDIIMFPHGDAHVMSSAPGMRSTPEMSRYVHPDEGQLPFRISMGSSHGEPTQLVCGFIRC
jgi:hypothetical protein